MSSKEQQKGRNAENAVALAYRRIGLLDADRRVAHGPLDQGDIAGVPGVCTQVKFHSSYSGKLAEWVAAANKQAIHAQAEFGVVWHRRRGKSAPEAWFVTMDGETWLKMYQYYLAAISLPPSANSLLVLPASSQLELPSTG